MIIIARMGLKWGLKGINFVTVDLIGHILFLPAIIVEKNIYLFLIHR